MVKETIFNADSELTRRSLEVVHRTELAQTEAEHYREQNRILEALREQDRQYFERLSQMKDDVMNTASHDLKNPLTSINISLHMLKKLSKNR